MLVELIIVLLLLVIIRLFWFKSADQQLLDKFPGPKAYPIIGNVLEFDYPKKGVTDTFIELSFKYGPVYLMRMGLEPVVCIRDPMDVEVVLGSTVDIDKAYSLYWPLHPWLKQGLLTSGGDNWRKHRKILTPAFHFKILENFIPIFAKNAHILVERLSQKFGKSIDIMPEIGPCSLDIITETTMGIEINAQLKESEYVKAVNELQEILAHRPYVFIYRTFLFDFLPIGRRHNRLIRYLHDFTENVLKERKAKLQNSASEMKNIDNNEPNNVGIKKRKGFLDLLLEFNKEGAGISDTEIRDEVNTFLFEGYDTTTSTISFCLYCISQNQDVQERLVEEIQDIFGDSTRDCTYKDLQEMNYMDKVIKETLRYYPTAQFVGRKASRNIQLNSGYVVPMGASIMVLIEAMNQDPKIFDKPLKFDPDRFDEKNPHPYAFVPFSAGPRNCIGQKYAQLEIKAVVSLLLRHFRLLPVNIPITPWFNIVMKSRTGVHLRLEHR